MSFIQSLSKTTRIVVFSLTAAVLVVFAVLSFLAGDPPSPDRIIDLVIGFGAGTGFGVSAASGAPGHGK